LGDPLYGKQRAFLTSKNPNEQAVAAALKAFKRQALHAATLGFIHPSTKEMMQFEQALPPDMAELVTILESLEL